MNGARGVFGEDPLLARPTQLFVAVLASVVAAWLIGSGDTHTLAAAAIGLVLVAALMRWPALTIVSLLIVCQELDPAQGFGGAGASGLLFLGHQIYFQTAARFSLLTLVVLLGLGRVAISAHPNRPRRTAVVIVLGFGAYITARLWADGTSLTSALNQDARFAILFGACFAIGVVAAGSRDWARNAVPVMQWVLSAMALIGLYLAVTGQGQGQVGTSVIFYDSAMGAIAGAVVLAAVITPAAERNWRIWWLGGAGLIIVVLSSRRNVWAAMVVALLLALTVIRNRARLAVRVVVALAVVLVGLAVVAPSIVSEIGHQLSAIWGATQGTSADASVQGHLSDVSIGWDAVKASPISGVGPNGHVAGLVVEGAGPLYIHNQVLESWLRFGLLGAILVIAAQVMFVVQGLIAVRRPGIDYTVRWAALLLVMAPVAMLTAPFLTTTQRWPAILGFAAGLIAPVVGGERLEPPSRPTARPEPEPDPATSTAPAPV
ncbi:MAG TPA: O-antigen ligase family protein [Solirubrobacteraceae bacterium]|jgi:O-antigen ligase